LQLKKVYNPLIAKKKPNYILYGFIIVSAGIHVLVLLHVAGIYESRTISYIELTMHEMVKSRTRNIPKPRQQFKPPEITKVENIQVRQFYRPENIKIDSVAIRQLKEPPEKITIDQLDHAKMAASDDKMPAQVMPMATAVPPGEEPLEFSNAREYFEMLILRIDSFKSYPESAKSRYIQGLVKIEFVLNKNGSISRIKIVKSSRHKNLDLAALKAVNKAAPFPKPPQYILNLPVKLQVNVLFELA